MHVLAATWGVGEVLWAMLVFFFWVCAIFLFIWVVIDIFARIDIGGGAKATWLLVVFILPVIGILIYLIARPPSARGNLVERPTVGDGRSAESGGPTTTNHAHRYASRRPGGTPNTRTERHR